MVYGSHFAKVPFLKILFRLTNTLDQNPQHKKVLKHSFTKTQIKLTITNMSDKQSSHSAQCHRSGAETCGIVLTKWRVSITKICFF